MNILRAALVIEAMVALSACGGGGGGSPPAPSPPPVPTFTVTGTVAGLAPGASVVLRYRGASDITVSANGAFSTPGTLVAGDAYTLVVGMQPAAPAQTCSVANGSGTIAAANVSNIAVTCVTNTYTAGGTLQGLASGASVTLRNSGGNDLALSANGAFTFTQPVASGSGYSVSVHAQPAVPAQTCSVANGSGTIAAANVGNIAVTCVTNTYTVGGTLQGLASGAAVTLRNGGNDLTLSGNGTFAFTQPVISGGGYAVSVQTQPAAPMQTCTATNASGTVGAANVSNVAVQCVTDTFAVGVTVTGLAGGSVVLRNNGGSPLTVSANGSFVFAQPVASGSNYSVAVVTQPAAPLQRCTVTSGAGTITAAAVSVAVSCQPAYRVSVDVTGLSGSDLRLRNRGTDELAVAGEGTSTFAIPLVAGESYNVAVSSQPRLPDHTCTVAQPTGAITNAPVVVAVSCVSDRFAYVANFLSDTLTRLSIHRTSGSATVLGNPIPMPDGPMSVVAEPYGRYLYVANWEAGNVSGFRIAAADGALTEIAGSPFTVGSHPAALATDSFGDYLFVANQLDNTVSMFRIDDATGALVEDAGSPYPSGGADPVALATTPSWACCSLYVVNRATNTVAGFEFETFSGRLIPIAVTPAAPTGSYTTSGIAVSATGEFALVTSTSTNIISTYERTSPSGDLTETPDSPLPSVGMGPCSVVAPSLAGTSFYATSYLSHLLVPYVVDPSKVTVAGTPVATGMNPCAVAANAQGTILYTANFGDNTISGFIQDYATGAGLQPVAGSPVGVGNYPLDIEIVNNRRDMWDLTIIF